MRAAVERGSSVFDPQASGVVDSPDSYAYPLPERSARAAWTREAPHGAPASVAVWDGRVPVTSRRGPPPLARRDLTSRVERLGNQELVADEPTPRIRLFARDSSRAAAERAARRARRASGGARSRTAWTAPSCTSSLGPPREDVRAFVAAMAAAHGLVAFDLDAGVLLASLERVLAPIVPARYRRRAMTDTRAFLAARGLPPGDLRDLPDSAKRFPDGAHYRVEIPSTEGPRCLEAVLEEAERLDVLVHRVSQGSGAFLLTDAELDEYARMAAAARVEVSMFAQPFAAWTVSATARARSGGVVAGVVHGQDGIVNALDDIRRSAAHGFRSVLISDVGLLAAFGEARRDGPACRPTCRRRCP